MNNKGQTLVVFVILLPLLFILISFIVDIGLLSMEKAKVTNMVKDSIKYVLKNNKSSGELTNLIHKNMSDIEINKLSIENNIWYLKISKKYDGLFFKKNYMINLSFKAYMENNNIIIKKE